MEYDAGAVRRENELLTAEVLHLRAELAQARRPLPSATAELPEPTLPGHAEAAQAPSAVPAFQGTQPVLPSEAEDDLRWLLARLEGLPIKHLLRRKAGYRRLVEKYLGAAEDPGN